MRAVVVGGGVAGPATAMALHRVGVDAVVIEGRPRRDPEEGSYLTVCPNGLDALERLDALSLARAAGFPTRRNHMVGAGGRRLGDIGLGAPLADGTPAITVKRSLLASSLAEEAVRRGVEIRYGARVLAADSTADGAQVILEDGEILRGDLVVGADGVHSRVRRAIDPGAPAARYVGLANFGGITRATRHATELAPEAWHFVFGRRAFFGALPTPAGDVVWFANVPRAEISAEERATTDLATWQRRLVEVFADDAGPAAELVRAGGLELAGDNTYDLGHVPRWHRGRMIVIGDAAHAPSPSSGQGASMALEDSVLLAMALRDHAGVEEAFAAFERLRRPRVERIVSVGARSSSVKTPGPVGRVLRDALLRPVLRYAVTDRSTSWMHDHRIRWDEPLQIG